MTSPWVLARQAHDQRLELGVDRRPAGTPMRIRPVAGHHPAMPAQQRLGCGSTPRGTPDQWAAVWVDALGGAGLMAKHQDLHLFGVSGPEHPDRKFDETHDTRVHKRPQHGLDILPDLTSDRAQDAIQCKIGS